MAKQNKKTTQQNIILGALIGGALGIGAVAAYREAKKRLPKGASKLALLEQIFSQIGSLVEEKSASPETNKKNKKSESKLEHILELTSEGLQLWNKIKKGV